MRYLMVENLLKLKGGEKVLDAGCGNGIYLHEFASRFGSIGLGVDARPKRVRMAEKINDELGYQNRFRTSTLENLSLGKSLFDKIVCLEVLEHIENDADVLRKLSRNLSKKGLMILSVPIKGTALTPEQENDPNFKPKKFEHVRSGYEYEDIKNLAILSGLKIVNMKKYFFFVSRILVKFQQLLYKRKMVLVNLLFSPVLTLLARLDMLFLFSPRGWLVVLKKR